MKKYISYFAILLASVVLFSCANDNNSVEVPTTPPGELGNITLQAVLMPAKEVMERRANEKMTYQNENGAIKMTWEQGDFLQLFDANGDFAASFVMTSMSDDNVVGTFNIYNKTSKFVPGEFDVYAFNANLWQTQANIANPQKPNLTDNLATSFTQSGFENMGFLTPYTILSTDTPVTFTDGATDLGTVNLYAQLYSLLQVDVQLPDGTDDYVTGMRMQTNNNTGFSYGVSVLQDFVTTVPTKSSLFIPVVAGTKINSYKMDIFTHKGNVYQFSKENVQLGDPETGTVAGLQYKTTIASTSLDAGKDEYTWLELNNDITNTGGYNSNLSILYFATSLTITDIYFGYINNSTPGGDGSTESNRGRINTTIKYTLNNSKQPKSLTFPNWVKQANSYSEIGLQNALFSMSNIKEINAPQLDFLMNYAFSGCSSLEQLNVPKLREVSGTNNSANLFDGTPLLEAINLPSLQLPAKLARGTFYGTGAKSISVGPGIKEIYSGIINTTVTRLESIELLGLIEMPIQESNPCSFLYYGSGVKNTTIKTINLPSLTTLREYGFSNLAALETVTFNAFTNYKQIKSTGISGSLAFPQYIFQYCDNLTNIEFGDSPANWETITYIGASAFTGTNIESIIAPALTSIGNGAFSNCSNLKTVRLENLIKLTAGGEFYNCYNLETLYIPNLKETRTPSGTTNCSFGVNVAQATSDITITMGTNFTSTSGINLLGGIFNNRFVPSTVYPTPTKPTALIGNENAGQVTLILGELLTKGQNPGYSGAYFSVTPETGSPTNGAGVLLPGTSTNNAYWWTANQTVTVNSWINYVYGPCTIQIVAQP